jgi:hypothetical protein
LRTMSSGAVGGGLLSHARADFRCSHAALDLHAQISGNRPTRTGPLMGDVPAQALLLRGLGRHRIGGMPRLVHPHVLSPFAVKRRRSGADDADRCTSIGTNAELLHQPRILRRVGLRELREFGRAAADRFDRALGEGLTEVHVD